MNRTNSQIKVTIIGQQPKISKKFSTVPIGTIFSWGNNIRQYLMCDNHQAVNIDSGFILDKEYRSEDALLVNYTEYDALITLLERRGLVE